MNGTSHAGFGGIVFNDTNANDRLDAGERRVVTDRFGRYTFDNLGKATMRVILLLPKGCRGVSPVNDFRLSPRQRLAHNGSNSRKGSRP
ncbi:MAG TPA: hypothetical protein VLI90_07705 [Tepidisphaeraceae bacterium]|nr:hypothetical protein [Tepidisphaeraceae bacterium]